MKNNNFTATSIAVKAVGAVSLFHFKAKMFSLLPRREIDTLHAAKNPHGNVARTGADE